MGSWKNLEKSMPFVQSMRLKLVDWKRTQEKFEAIYQMKGWKQMRNDMTNLKIFLGDN